MMAVMESLAALSTGDLLRLYGQILTELRGRGVLRTGNAPLGDYAEYLAWRALGGVLEPNSTKSHDITTAAGSRVQVKARTVGTTTRSSAKFSAIRSWDFDELLFLKFSETSNDLLSAVMVPSESVRAAAKFSAHTNAWTITLGTDLLALPGAADVSRLLQQTKLDVD